MLHTPPPHTPQPSTTTVHTAARHTTTRYTPRLGYLRGSVRDANVRSRHIWTPRAAGETLNAGSHTSARSFGHPPRQPTAPRWDDNTATTWTYHRLPSPLTPPLYWGYYPIGALRVSPLVLCWLQACCVSGRNAISVPMRKPITPATEGLPRESSSGVRRLSTGRPGYEGAQCPCISRPPRLHALVCAAQ